MASDSGGDVPTYSASNLPSGLSIDPRSGLISGTPTTAQTVSVTVIAADSATQGSTTFNWTVAGLPGGNGGNGGGGTVTGRRERRWCEHRQRGRRRNGGRRRRRDGPLAQRGEHRQTDGQLR